MSLGAGALCSVQTELDLLDLLEQLGELVVVALEELVDHPAPPCLFGPLVLVVLLGVLLGLAAFFPTLG